MSGTKISGLTALTGASTQLDDYLEILDTHDTTTAPAGPGGSNKKQTIAEHLAALEALGFDARYLPGYVSLTKGAANLIPTLVFDAVGHWTVLEVPVTIPRLGGLRILSHSYGSLSGTSSLVGNFANFIRRFTTDAGAPPQEVDLWFRASAIASSPTLGDSGSGGLGIGGAFRFAFPLHAYGQPSFTTPLAGARAYPAAALMCLGVNDASSTVSGARDPNALNAAQHSMRAILAYWRARAVYAADDAAIAYNGTWVGVATDKNFVPRGKYNSSTTLNDYAEYTIPTTYTGGPIGLILLGNPNGRSTLSSGVTFTTGTGGDLNIPVATRTCYPQSGQFVIQIDSEQILINSGQGAGAGTLVAATGGRGYNGTTAVAHSSGADVVRPKTSTYLDFTGSTANLDGAGAGVAPVSVRGFDGSGHFAIAGQGSSGAGIGGSQRAGQEIQMVARFTGLTAADAGLKIRAQLKNGGTQTGSVPGENFRPCAWIIEDPEPQPQFVVNQPNIPLTGGVVAGIVGGMAGEFTAIATLNANLATLVGEFADAYLVDIASTFAAYFEATVQTATSTGTTIHVTPSNPTLNILSKGSVISVEGEVMLITSTITKTSGTDWSFTVTRAYAGTDAPTGTLSSANHAIGALVVNCLPWSVVDGLHPSDFGHELFAAQCITTLNTVPVTSARIAQTGGYKGREKQGWAQPVSGVPYALYRPNSNGNRTTATLTLSKEWAEPLWIEDSGLISAFECFVTLGGLSSTLRWCLYADDKGAPGQLIYDTGAAYGPGVVSTTTGTNYWATASIPGGIPVVRGWYWMSVIAQTGTAPVVRANNAGSPPMKGYLIPEDQATAATTHAATGLSRTFSAASDWAIGSQTLEVDSLNWPLTRAGFEKYITG